MVPTKCHGPRCSLAGLGLLPWSTAPASGPVGRPGLPSASDPGGVDRCVLFLCGPRCVCVCGVLAHLAPVHRCTRPLSFVRGVRGHMALVHRCTRSVRYVCAVGDFVGDPPSPTPFPPFFSRIFVRALYLFFFPRLLLFFFKNLLFFESEKGARAHCRHRHGELMQRCSSVAFFIVMCVVSALSAVAPQGCGSRALMYMGACQGGMVRCLFAVWCWLLCGLCGVWVRAVATVHPRWAGAGVKGSRLWGVARVPGLVINCRWRAAWARPREYPPFGLAMGAAGRGVSRVMLCCV